MGAVAELTLWVSQDDDGGWVAGMTATGPNGEECEFTSPPFASEADARSELVRVRASLAEKFGGKLLEAD